MQLERRGVKFVHPGSAAGVAGAGRTGAGLLDAIRRAPRTRSGRSRRRTRRATRSSARRSAASAGSWSDLLEMTPPSIDAPSTGEVWELLKTGRKFRALGKKESLRAAALGPDGGRGSRRRVVRDRSAAGERRRAGDSRHGDGPVVRRHRRGAAARRRDRSGARRQQRDRRWAARAPSTRAMAEAAREAGAEIRTGAGRA